MLHKRLNPSLTNAVLNIGLITQALECVGWLGKRTFLEGVKK
jgi:hypothetical protein